MNVVLLLAAMVWQVDEGWVEDGFLVLQVPIILCLKLKYECLTLMVK